MTFFCDKSLIKNPEKKPSNCLSFSLNKTISMINFVRRIHVRKNKIFFVSIDLLCLIQNHTESRENHIRTIAQRKKTVYLFMACRQVGEDRAVYQDNRHTVLVMDDIVDQLGT